MRQLYVVCEFGLDTGRVVTGTLSKGRLEISETRRFANIPVTQDASVHWNIPELYDEVLQGLRSVWDYEEPVAGISSVSWPGAYMLIDAEGALIMPTYHHCDPRLEQGIAKIRSSAEVDRLFDETGTHPLNSSMLFQLSSEASKRLKQAAHVLPIADGFNFLFSGVPATDPSMASATQMFNPATGAWSEQLLRLSGVPPRLMPQLVASGTSLGPLRPELAPGANLEAPEVLTTCSDQMAAALLGLPVQEDENWAFLYPGKSTVMGAPVEKPLLSDEAHDLNFNSQLGYGGSTYLYKRTNGLGILDACVEYWDERNRGMDPELMSHLAGSAAPFESLIDPSDPRFFTPNDMPLKIQAYCKETNQPVPRKPGPVYRCILESLALMYRKMLQETAFLSGKELRKVYVFSSKSHTLLNHFIANALQMPIVIASSDSTVLGNIVVQALALGHVKSLPEARELLRQSVKLESLAPHASVWDMAYDRFVALTPSIAEAV